jgi:hypothetical protein
MARIEEAVLEVVYGTVLRDVSEESRIGLSYEVMD